MQQVGHIGKKANGYNGYAGYASKTAIPQIAKQGEGAALPAHCASDITEGDHCSDAEAEQRALESVGLTHSQILADALRREVFDALTFAPLPCTDEGRRWLRISRKFLESPWFDVAVRLGGEMVSLFGVAADPMTCGKEHMGLVVWLALNPSRAKLEELTADCAQAGTRWGKVDTFSRFDFLINDDAVLWWHAPQIIGEAAA